LIYLSIEDVVAGQGAFDVLAGGQALRTVCIVLCCLCTLLPMMRTKAIGYRSQDESRPEKHEHGSSRRLHPIAAGAIYNPEISDSIER
jgi:hypothetical protein